MTTPDVRRGESGPTPVSRETERWSFHPSPGERSTAGVAALDLAPTVYAARAGDELAFEQLVETYRSTAERVARHILKTEEAAADAVQDALIKVYHAMPRFQDGNFRSWLLRIVTNTCYDYLRRQRRRPAVSLEEMMEDSYVDFTDGRRDDPETLVLRKEQQEALLQAIQELAPWHRDVVVLVDVHGYDYTEAASTLGVPLGTVKSRLSRARSALRNRLVSAHLLQVTGTSGSMGHFRQPDRPPRAQRVKP